MADPFLLATVVSDKGTRFYVVSQRCFMNTVLSSCTLTSSQLVSPPIQRFITANKTSVQKNAFI